jgi:hypothetical protein
MFYTIVGAGAVGAGAESRYGSGSGSDQKMRLRLRNTDFKNRVKTVCSPGYTTKRKIRIFSPLALFPEGSITTVQSVHILARLFFRVN